MLYEDPETKLIRTATGLNLVTVLGSAPSWSTSTPHPIPYLQSPNRLEWYSRLDAWAAQMFDFDRPPFSIAHVLRSISLFGKTRGMPHFLYLGTGRITSCGPCPTNSTGTTLFNMCCRITPTMRRDVWELLGGYRRWMISLGGRDFFPNCDEDAAKLIQETWGTGDFLLITRYEGDELRASINDKGQATVSYSASPTADILFSGRYTVADELGEWACFPLESGDNGWESPVSTIIDRNEALSIIGTYLSTGWPSGLRRAE